MLEEARQRMQKAIEHLLSDIAQIRTGRANPSLIADVKVLAYDTTLTVKELAQISAPEPHLLVISPYDKSVGGNITKGIEMANLGLNPIVDKDLIRITIPPLTEERRKEFVKTLHQKLELYRVEIRQIRRELLERLERQQKSGDVSENETQRLEKQLQELVDETIDEIDILGEHKEKEIMEI